MPSEPDTIESDAVEDGPVDEARQALLEAVTGELGTTLVDAHLHAGRDLTVRVSTDAWGETASYLRHRQQFRFFGWLSAIDWLPSPFGRSLDADVDNKLAVESEVEDDDASAIVQGVTGGETRFQVLARVHNLTTGLGLTVKTDVDDDALEVASWTPEFPGADWHEREAYEMFGISFAGHPGLRNLYLPGNFEGHPLRKDYPLLARLVKPWPGIVDVEPMPEVDPPAEAVAAAPSDGPTTENPEDSL